jgi:hypothetical protein
MDDLLVTCQLDSAITHLQRSFKEISVVRGNNHSYLAMNLEVDARGIHLDMMGYIDKCLEGRKHVKSRATDDLFNTPEASDALGEGGMKMFHSDVAKLLYLAKRTKPDILTAVSHLSSNRGRPAKLRSGV